MSEKSMRSWLVRVLKPLDARPVENLVEPGYPDVEMIGSTAELKFVASAPVRPGTPVLVDHFTPEQRLWIRRRWSRGGQVRVVLRVEDEWFLLPGGWAWKHLGKTTLDELRQNAERRWDGKPPADELLEAFRGRREA